MKRNHTFWLISIFISGLAVSHSSDARRTSASDVFVSAQADGELRGVLDRSVTAAAAGRGNPWITFRDGHVAPTQYQGSSNLVQQLKDNQLRPLSLGSDDFDEDGVPDIVAGYAGTKNGLIALQRGDADTIFPNTREAITHRAQLRTPAGQQPAPDDIQSPFFVQSRVLEVPGAPQFLGTGDFDADGHRDVVAAEPGGSALVLLPGDGYGGFARARSIALSGKVTALVTGDVNRMDGLADVVVGVAGVGGPRLLVYEGASGALNTTPEIINLPSESKSIAIGQLDDNFPVDIAVGAGRDLLIVQGRDRKHVTLEGKKLDAQPPVVARIAVPFAIASVAIGDFTGDLRQEIALLSDVGTCHVFSRTSSTNGSRWQEVSALALPVSQKNQPSGSLGALIPVRISSSPKDDLMLLDQAAHQLHMIINESANTSANGTPNAPASSRLFVAGALDIASEPVAVIGMRLNIDAVKDLVVLKSNTSAPTVVITTPAMTFSVTNTSDDGPGSLRQAIFDANSNPGTDAINFNIPGTGTQTITPLSQFPSIVQPLTIDGTTQNPASPTPPIELSGSALIAKALSIQGGGSTVRGLVINNFFGVAIEFVGSGGNLVEGNYIGTSASGGSAGPGNGESGVAINTGSFNTIGGTVAAARNVISANVGQGVLTLGPATNNLVRGNFIGTNAAGTSGLGNLSDGIEMVSASNSVMNCTVGGTTAGAGNVISGNNGVGIQFISVGTSNLVQGNLIGTDASGANQIGNGSSGVALTEATNSTIGGTAPGSGNVISGNGSDGIRINSATATGNVVQGNKIGVRANGTTPLPNGSNGILILNSANGNSIGGAAGNIIAYHFGAGVFVDSGTSNARHSNSIFSNTGLGIDLAPAGVTANDSGDADTGPNNRQNFPMLTAANGGSGGGANIQGTLNSIASTTFTLDFFSNPSCDASGNGEGQTFLGSATATTAGSGNVTFNVTLASSATVGQSITATATSPDGNTSEFSACVVYGAADLAVIKTASSGTVVAGSGVTYTITLTNNGPDPAPSITVTDNLPSSVTFVSCSATAGGVCGGSDNNRIVSFNSLAAGASATITIGATLSCSVANGATVTNVASVVSTLRDPVSGNNASTGNFTASNPPRAISPTSESFASDGGSGMVNITAPSGCGWQAVSNDAWLLITSIGSGNGNGTLAYNVATNMTGSPRTGTLTIAGLTFTVNQSNLSCSYSILPTSNSLPAEGGTGVVSITTLAGCGWKAIPNVAWIIVTEGANGIGNGSMNYTVQANTSSIPRTGAIDIAGQTFTVMQGGVPCTFSIAPTGKLFGETGGEASVALTTLEGCNWNATSKESWVTITSEDAGTGPGVISYAVRDNLTGVPRLAVIKVAGLDFTVVQDGGTASDCTYVLNPTSSAFGSAGGNGSIQIITEERCAWEATTNASWIMLTSTIVGIGTNSVTYQVAANPNSGGRSGTITIAGVTFKVKQKGH